jgi:hypothetical protein
MLVQDSLSWQVVDLLLSATFFNACVAQLSTSEFECVVCCLVCLHVQRVANEAGSRETEV